MNAQSKSAPEPASPAITAFQAKYYSNTTEENKDWVAPQQNMKNAAPEIRIPTGSWISIVVKSFVFGVLIYGAVIGLYYKVTANQMVKSKAHFSMPWSRAISGPDAAAVILADVGIPNNQNLQNEIVTAIRAAAPKEKAGDSDAYRASILSVATQLVLARIPGSCSDCALDCSAAVEPIIVRMLLGWPMSSVKRTADVDYLHNIFNLVANPAPSSVPSVQEKQRACTFARGLASVSPWQISTTMIWGRQEPWPAPLVAELILGSSNCVTPNAKPDDKDRCLLVTRLFQTVIDDEDVKFDRAFLVDFMYGWERLAVVILFLIVTLALMRLRKGRLRLQYEVSWVQAKLKGEPLQAALDPTYAKIQEPTELAALSLKQAFDDTFKPDKSGATQEPIWELVSATAEAVQQKDLQYMDSFVERNLAEMDASREFMTSIITIFPVIGFGATLLSLVHALAGANQIATSSGDLRSAAILNVTSLLSSCFATTFLALVSMAMFAVLNLLGAGSEKRLVTTLSERLISTFRPGR
jgi:hypothetical protein